MYSYVRLDPINRYDPTGDCDWNVFMAGAIGAAGGGLTVAAVAMAPGGPLVGAGLMITGTAAAVTGMGAMIGSCTGVGSDQLSQMVSSANPGGAVSIVVGNIYGAATGSSVDNGKAANMGAFVWDAATGSASAFQAVAAGVQDTKDLLNLASAAYTAVSDSAWGTLPTPTYALTATTYVNGSADAVPYDPSEISSPDGLTYSGGGGWDDSDSDARNGMDVL